MLANFKISSLLVFCVLTAGIVTFFISNFFWSGASVSAAELNIYSGQGFYDITSQLAQQGIIESRLAFEIYGLISGDAARIKPGRYFLNTNFSIPALFDILTSGPKEISATITPGMNLREIDEKLSSLGIIKHGELTHANISVLRQKYDWFKTDSLEGFLVPDTYNFFSGASGEEIAETMLDNFSKKDLPFFKNYSSIAKTINLASILEKEVPDYNDRRLVAGILLKRLNEGMPLQVDASLLYYKCAAGFSGCSGLTPQDYKTDSPYNTYTIFGFPKTPIGNPSLEAIRAALNPQTSDYWYYLSDPKTRKTIFSKTLDEHNANRSRYLVNK